MKHLCTCGYSKEHETRLEKCPNCGSDFNSLCRTCRFIYSYIDRDCECICGDTIVAFSLSDKMPESGEPGEGEPKAEDKCPQSLCSLLSEPKGRSKPNEKYASLPVKLEDSRKEIHGRIAQILGEVIKLRDDIFRSHQDNAYTGPFLNVVDNCFAGMEKAADEFFALLQERAWQDFFTSVAIAAVQTKIAEWLAIDAKRLTQAKKISDQSVKEIETFQASENQTLVLLGQLVAKRLLEAIEGAGPLVRKLAEMPANPFSCSELRAGMCLDTLKKNIVATNPRWLSLLRPVSTPHGFRYVYRFWQLRDELPEDISTRRSFTLLDCNTFGLQNPGTFTAKELAQMGIPNLVLVKVQEGLGSIGMKLIAEFWSTLALIEQFVDVFGDVRLRVLSRRRPRTWIVQRSKQSGDSNGVAFCLVAFDEYFLLYLLPKDKVAEAESALKFYTSLGISPERIRISVVCGDDEDLEGGQLVAIAERLRSYTRRRIDTVHYGSAKAPAPAKTADKGKGGAKAKSADKGDADDAKDPPHHAPVNSLYQQLSNLNYVTKAEDLAYLDAIYELKVNAYKHVGSSTDTLYRYAMSNPNGDAYIAYRIRQALDQNVKPDARNAIEAFADRFSQQCAKKYIDLVPLREPVTITSTQRGMDLHSGASIRSRPDFFHPLVLLYWVRGPQGEEAREMQYMDKDGVYGMVPRGGKPWHHATMQLLATVRALALELADGLGVPVYFVPVGDVPEEAYRKIRFYPMGPQKKEAAVSAPPESLEKPPLPAKDKPPEVKPPETQTPGKEEDVAQPPPKEPPKKPLGPVDGGPGQMTPGGPMTPGITRLVCLAQQRNTCGQRAVYNVKSLIANPAGDVATLTALANDAALRGIGPMAVNIDDNAVSDMLGNAEVAIVSSFDEVRFLVDHPASDAPETGSKRLVEFMQGTRNDAYLVLNTLASDYADSLKKAVSDKQVLDKPASTGMPEPKPVPPTIVPPSMGSVGMEPVPTATAKVSDSEKPVPLVAVSDSGKPATEDPEDSNDGKASAPPEKAKSKFEQYGFVDLRVEYFQPKYSNVPESLVQFFNQLDAFKKRDRFNQLYLFHELMKRESHGHEALRVIQVGLRSGAIEQGMYLGIPTVYVDIETESIKAIRPGEPDTTQRMFKMTAEQAQVASAKKGSTSSGKDLPKDSKTDVSVDAPERPAQQPAFPKFHCLFSTNVIGVYNRIVGDEEVIRVQRFVRSALRGAPDSSLAPLSPKRPPQAQDFWRGTLRYDEVRSLHGLLFDMYLDYENHWTRLMRYKPPARGAQPADEPEPTGKMSGLGPSTGKFADTADGSKSAVKKPRSDTRVGHYIAVQLYRESAEIKVRYCDSLAIGGDRTALLVGLLAALRAM